MVRRDIYPVRLHISEEGGAVIIPPIDINLLRVVSDWGTLLKEVIEDDIREGGYLDDHEEGEFDCLILWKPITYHTQDGDEYDLDFEVLKEVKADEKRKLW
jgi:hypothetical protein